MRIMLISLLVIFMVSIAMPFENDELPFGAMYYNDYSQGDLDDLDLTCFNFISDYDYVNDTKLQDVANRDLFLINCGKDGSFNYDRATAFFRYTWSNYGIIDVGYPHANPEVAMIPLSGHWSNDNSMWVSDSGSADILSGFSTHLQKFNSNNVGNAYDGQRIKVFERYLGRPFSYVDDGNIEYTIEVGSKVDVIGDTLDVVAVVLTGLSKWDADSVLWDTLGLITAGDFDNDNTLKPLSFTYTFPDSYTYFYRGSAKTIYENSTKRDNAVFSLEIQTTGAREFSVDEIKMSDLPGRYLVEDTLYNQQIRAEFDTITAYPEDIYGWMQMDEPVWLNFAPLGHVDSLMHTVNSDWVTFTNFWQYIKNKESYFNEVDIDYVNPDIYPFGWYNSYCGTDYQIYREPTKDGPLDRFDNHLKMAKPDGDSLVFWVTPQSFGCLEYDASNCGWRKPTASELSVQTFMALSWGARGIHYWFYYSTGFSNMSGIIDNDGTKTDSYYEIKDYIGPYIQAFDEYYMPLKWIHSYQYNPDDPDVPDSSVISSIQAYSHPDSTNPDVGWFQVGEFEDTIGSEKYFMLVNRACNINSTLIAPSVTAIVELSRGAFPNANRLFVVDLANDLDKINGEWTAIPDTTYCYVNNRNFFYETRLRAGEGRLYKIVEIR